MANGLLGKGSTPSVVDIRAFLDSGVPDAIAGIVDLGCLVSIGTTRDGGAVSITITHEGEWDREYFRASDEALVWLESAAGILRGRGLASRNVVSNGSQKPVRGRRPIR